MNHNSYIVVPENCDEFTGYIYQHRLLQRAISQCQDGVLYKYPVKDSVFYVWDSSINKIVTNLKDYNSVFDKRTGKTLTYGATESDNVTWCQLGPEILDLEISVNGCPKVAGHNCRFCYKNNTDAPAKNMSFDTFKRIIDNFPRNLYSVAFGITGTKTNPDFPKMLEYCRSIGIIPNYTLSGADIDESIYEATGHYCGAVAVSCYEGNKELCYNTIASFAEKCPTVHVNMHIVLSKGTLPHVMDVLNDLKRTKLINRNVTVGKYTFATKYKVPEDQRLEQLRHVVFLRIKPVGRAQAIDCEVGSDIFKKVIDFCQENEIGFGFDSCSAKDVESVLVEKGNTDAPKYCQPCESTTQSIYVSCEGKMIPCSFCENHFKDKSIDLTTVDDFIKEWNDNVILNEFREKSEKCKGYCPMFNLSSK